MCLKPEYSEFPLPPGDSAVRGEMRKCLFFRQDLVADLVGRRLGGWNREKSERARMILRIRVQRNASLAARWPAIGRPRSRPSPPSATHWACCSTSSLEWEYAPARHAYNGCPI